MEKCKEIAEKIRNKDQWDLDLCESLCEEAGMLDEWKESDGDSFEQVVFRAAEKLGVEIS